MSERHPSRIVAKKPHARQLLHRHGDARLILFLSGELSEISFGSEGRFARGDLLFRPAFFGHADNASGLGSSYIHLPISSAAVRACAKNRGWRPVRGRLKIDNMNLESILSLPSSGDRLLESLQDVAYGAPPTHTRLHLAANRLAGEGEVRIAELSESLDIRPYEFSRRFAREFGMAPRAYRNQARLQRAMSLLTEGGASLTEIAAASGHYDQSHLTRNLKRETGRTPREFRAAASIP
jgi:AraC-like DNA-binding protein